MESVTAIVPPEPVQERAQSSIEFPYTDLDNAGEVVRGVHRAGGTACDYDQLAAELNAVAKGGNFRLRVNGAKSFGLINYDRGGRITLTELGRQFIESSQERSARVSAFLSVPLYQKVFEQFKGSLLPPAPGLERAIEGMGVGSKVKDRARQVLMRSAKQAGFFEHGADRLVKPSIRHDQAGQHASPEETKQLEPKKSSSGGGDGGGVEHPLIQGILMTLPKPGSEWAAQDRVNWLSMASSIFKMIYTDVLAQDILISLKGDGDPQR